MWYFFFDDFNMYIYDPRTKKILDKNTPLVINYQFGSGQVLTIVKMHADFRNNKVHKQIKINDKKN